jgi:hypothetical protein
MTPALAAPTDKLDPLTGLWRSLFRRDPIVAAASAREPLRCAVPRLRGAEIAALYYDHRMGETSTNFSG